MALSKTTRHLLHIQGFESVADDDLARVEPWLRLTPALCGLIVAIATVLSASALLFALTPLAAFGAIFPFHPFDLVYNHGLRRLAGSPPMPPNGPPRRFACGLGAVWIFATGLAFATGAPAAGYVLGGMFAAVAGVVSTTHICIPSLVFRAGRRLARLQSA